jgi:hypothetical protein
METVYGIYIHVWPYSGQILEYFKSVRYVRVYYNYLAIRVLENQPY